MFGHSTPRGALVGEAVYAHRKINILCGGRVNTRRRVNPKLFGLSAENAIDARLKHLVEFGPESHRNAIMVEVKHRNLVPLVHQIFKLIVQLDAKKNGGDVEAPRLACTRRCC